MSAISQFFDQVGGSWNFVRNILGEEGALPGTVHGTANFSAGSDGNEFLFQEIGVFTPLAGTCFDVSASYTYRYEDSTLNVYKHDGSHLHTFAFTQATYPLQATAVHHCGNDIYKATYTFFSECKFQISYSIKGPNKNYSMDTTFTKILSGKV